MNADKSHLRKQLRSARRSLSQAEQQQHSLKICKQIAQQDFFQRAQCIAAYLCFDGEVNVNSLIDIAWKQGKKVALPIVPDNNNQPLTFALYQPNTPTILDRFGIVSPDLSTAETVNISDINLVLTPLVGFDKTGTRMGMGAGFYDRTFEKHHQSNRLMMIGVAHQCQHVEILERQDWDIPLPYIVTDQQVYNCLKTSL